MEKNMSLEPIIPINSIDEINNSSNPLEFQKIIVGIEKRI